MKINKRQSIDLENKKKTINWPWKQTKRHSIDLKNNQKRHSIDLENKERQTIDIENKKRQSIDLENKQKDKQLTLKKSHNQITMILISKKLL